MGNKTIFFRNVDTCHYKIYARRLGAICVVAGGYGGDMQEDKANELLDDIDFYYNKVKCRKIEQLLPALNKLVVEEQQSWMNSI